MQLRREGASVMSHVQRDLAFLDSPLVAEAVAHSTFDLMDLLKAGSKQGTTLFLQIPPDQLEAQRGLVRCWLATMIRMIGRCGDERKTEVLLPARRIFRPRRHWAGGCGRSAGQGA